MSRIAGINIPNNKNIEIGLSYLYGIGRTLAKKIAEEANIDPATKIGDLSEAELERVRALIDRTYKVEGDLKMEVNQNIKRLKEISAYRGLRHMRNLPVHGQRTKTNARTKRGRKVTVGSGRKKSAEKT
jgi:small subunit ribosomal protein S13